MIYGCTGLPKGFPLLSAAQTSIADSEHCAVSQDTIKPLLATEEKVELAPEDYLLVKAVLTHAFEGIKSEARVKNWRHSYFVKILGKNPDSDILMGIEDDGIKIKPTSMGQLRNGVVYDPNGDVAELFSVDRIINDGECACVTICFYSSGLGTFGCEWLFARRNGLWVIEGLKNAWLS